MKVLFVTAAALLVVAQQAYAAPPQMVMDCLMKNGATMDDAKKFGEKGEASEGLKCTFKCMMLGNGGMTEDAKLVLEPMLANTPESAHETLKECVNIEQGGSDLCDLAYRHHVCIRENNPTFYMEMLKGMSK